MSDPTELKKIYLLRGMADYELYRSVLLDVLPDFRKAMREAFMEGVAELERARVTAQAPATPETVTIKRACELLSVSRSTVYNLMDSGDLESVTIGRRRLVRCKSIGRFIESRMKARRQDSAPVRTH